MSDALRAAREWLAEQIEEGYVDESGANDSDKYPEVGWRHLKVLAMDRTCATCRWAVREQGDDPVLTCYRITENDGASPSAHDLAVIAVDPPQNDSVCLDVAPTFGCVQWEAKS